MLSDLKTPGLSSLRNLASKSFDDSQFHAAELVFCPSSLFPVSVCPDLGKPCMLNTRKHPRVSLLLHCQSGIQNPPSPSSATPSDTDHSSFLTFLFWPQKSFAEVKIRNIPLSLMDQCSSSSDLPGYHCLLLPT